MAAFSIPQGEIVEIMKAYVTGDRTVPELFSDLKGQDKEALRGLIRAYREEFEALNPARAVMLESII